MASNQFTFYIPYVVFYFRIEPVFYIFFLEKSAMGAPENEMEEFQESRKLLNLDEKLIKRMLLFRSTGFDEPSSEPELGRFGPLILIETIIIVQTIYWKMK